MKKPMQSEQVRWFNQMEQQQMEGDPPPADPPLADPPPADPPLLGDDLSFRQGWQETLPEEFRAQAANFKTLPDLVKSLRHFQQVASGKLDGMVKIPGEDATPEEKAAFYKARGVPEDPTGYEIQKPEGELAEYYNEDQVQAFAKEAHEKGLSKDEVSWLVNYQLGKAKEAAEAEAAEGRAFLEERDKILRTAFGNQVDVEVNNAKRVLLTIDPSFDLEQVQFLPPKLLIGLAHFSRKMAPDQLVSQTQVENRLTPADQGRDIIHNPNNPDYEAYHNVGHPRHKAVTQKVLDIFAKG